MAPYRWIASFALTAALLGCSDPTGPDARELRERLDSARRRWAVVEVQSYRMTVRLHGAWISGTAQVEVRDGVPVEVVPAAGQPAATTADTFRYHDTVEELFDLVEEALNGEPEHLEARFHPTLGVPMHLDVDGSFAAADDEYGFTVEGFRTLR